MITVTFDTNCFFDYFQRAQERIQPLVNLAQEGKIDIAMTTRVMTDTYDKSNGTSEIWCRIQSFPALTTVGAGFRLGMSRLGSGDFLTSEHHSLQIQTIRNIMVDAQIADVDHLFAHLVAKRDIFVTSDGHFLDHDHELREALGVVVAKPEDAIREIKKLLTVNPHSDAG